MAFDRASWQGPYVEFAALIRPERERLTRHIGICQGPINGDRGFDEHGEVPGTEYAMVCTQQRRHRAPIRIAISSPRPNKHKPGWGQLVREQ